MHARELVELAAQVSANGARLARGAGVITPTLLQSYWSASKARFDSWSRDLKAYQRTTADLPAHQLRSQFQSICGVVAEIVSTESLTRVFGAVVGAWDHFHGSHDGEPIVHSVIVGHMEARHRALTLLLHATGVDVDMAVGLNRLCRHTERWTDLLIGYLLADVDVSRFANQPQRAREFADDLRSHAAWQAGQPAWKALLTSLRGGFRHLRTSTTPNADLNARIAACIVQCFQPLAIELPGPTQPDWTDRVIHLADDTEEMILQLCAAEGLLRTPGKSATP